MKIYTRTGDSGQTSIVGGQRLPKNAPRIEAYGTIDELNSHLGLLAAMVETPAAERSLLLQIQNLLFNLGSYLAGSPDVNLSQADIQALEESIDRMDSQLPALRNFILPGGSLLSAQTHIARTVCRRAERRILSAADSLSAAEIPLKYINRLSDWLFTFARYANHRQEIPENVWKTPK